MSREHRHTGCDEYDRVDADDRRYQITATLARGP